MSPVKETDKQATLGSVPIIIIMREKKKAKGECECERKMICISFDTETKKKWEVGHPPPHFPCASCYQRKDSPNGAGEWKQHFSPLSLFLLSFYFFVSFSFSYARAERPRRRSQSQGESTTMSWSWRSATAGCWPMLPKVQCADPDSELCKGFQRTKIPCVCVFVTV